MLHFESGVFRRRDGIITIGIGHYAFLGSLNHNRSPGE